MCKDVLGMIETKKNEFACVGELTAAIVSIGEGWPGEKLRVEVKAEKVLLRCEGGLREQLDVIKDGGGSGNGKLYEAQGQW